MFYSSKFQFSQSSTTLKPFRTCKHNFNKFLRNSILVCYHLTLYVVTRNSTSIQPSTYSANISYSRNNLLSDNKEIVVTSFVISARPLGKGKINENVCFSTLFIRDINLNVNLFQHLNGEPSLDLHKKPQYSVI